MASALLASVTSPVLISSTSVDSAGMGAPSEAGKPAANPTPTAPNRQGPFALVVVVDAARYDEFDLSRMPNLAKLVAGGTQYSQAIVGLMPSLTQTSHATIGTGVLPKRHLIVGDTWRVPGTDQMAPSLLNGNLVRTGFIGKLIRQTHSPSIGGMVHRHYPGSLVVSVSGHKAYAADAMGAGTADFVAFGGNDSRGHYVPGAEPGRVPDPSILTSPQLDLPSYPRVPGVEDNWVTTLAEKFLFKYHPRVLMINLPEVDTFGHSDGTNATVMQPLMTAVDHQIGRLVAAYTRAGMIDSTYIIITSDHGMVPAVHTVNSDQIHAVITKAGGNPLYVGHGDDTPIWLKNPTQAPKVAGALSAANIPGVASVFVRQPKGGYRIISPSARLAVPQVAAADSHLLATYDSTESPDIVLLYDENTMTITPHLEQIGRKGDHGGASWGSQHIPLVIAGPQIRAGYTSTYPARLVDIAPTLETFLGIQPKNQDGAPLVDAMVRPPAWAAAPHKTEGARVMPDVLALEQEAAARPNLK